MVKAAATVMVRIVEEVQKNKKTNKEEVHHSVARHGLPERGAAPGEESSSVWPTHTGRGVRASCASTGTYVQPAVLLPDWLGRQNSCQEEGGEWRCDKHGGRREEDQEENMGEEGEEESIEDECVEKSIGEEGVEESIGEEGGEVGSKCEREGGREGEWQRVDGGTESQ